MKNSRRYAIVMLIGFLMNEILHQIANFYHLPVWLDMTGTALVAIILEPAAALIVGLANNFILAIFYYNARSLFYYSVSASVALIVGLLMKKNGRIQTKNIVLTMALCVIIPSFLSGSITLWENKGISSSSMERMYYEWAVSKGVPNIISTYFGAFVLKIYDVIAGTAIVSIVYRLLPDFIKYDSKTE